MTLTAHVCTACAIGVATGDPLLGFLGGFLSHHVLDAIPHSDAGSLGANVNNMLKSNSLKYVILDIVLAGIIFFTIWGRYSFNLVIFFSALGGALPDIIDNSPFWSKYTRKVFPTNYYHKFHETVHFTILNKRYFWVGIATQALFIMLSLYYIYYV
ncbi:MAG: hypothetical protein BWY70_01890 [Bacteroidetes bacterium ADurb.Bin408]|nr:MAG: hypothetical protein BWY70_01890 [Bacteroidetes bacterium ADurb.Bin408]